MADSICFSPLPGDQPGALTFIGSPTAELFTREVRESFECMLGGLMTRTGPNAGFVSTSLPGRAVHGTSWTRDTGTLLRETALWGYLGHARLIAGYLMRQVLPNADGFFSYPMLFHPGEPASGDELDGTANIVIALAMLWRRLPAHDADADAIYEFLHQPSSPLAYMHHVLADHPLIAGTGEFGGGMGVDGPQMNVVQNGLCRLALLAGALLEESVGDQATAVLHRSAADRLTDNIRRYLLADDGGWIWCISPDTLRPEAEVLNAEWNRGFTGINGVSCMQADVLGFSAADADWLNLAADSATLERLLDSPVRRALFARDGMFPQFEQTPSHQYLTSPSYGQGYAIQTLLLLDRMEEAGRAVDYLARATYQPPADYRLDRDSPYWFYERYLSPEFPDIAEFDQGCGALTVVNVTEPLKAARMIAGIDDTNATFLRIIPRVPPTWSGFHAENWPVATAEGLRGMSIYYQRDGEREMLALNVNYGTIDELIVQLGTGSLRPDFRREKVSALTISYSPTDGYETR